MIYAAIGSAILTAMGRELFFLSPAITALTAIVSFLLFLYFKRREFLSDKLAVYIDFPIFTAMILGLAYTFYLEFSDLHFLTWFKDLNFMLVFWGVFLLGIFLCILLSLRFPVDQQHPDAFRQPDRPVQPGQYPLF